MGSPVVSNQSCSINSSPLQAVCSFDFSGGDDDRPDIKLAITLQNANMAFADVPSPLQDPWNVTIKDGSNSTVSGTGSNPYGPWSTFGTLGANSGPLPTVSLAANPPLGTVTLTYTGRIRNANTMQHAATIIVPLPAPSYLPRLIGPSSMDWFISNQWYRQTYYAISTGLAPGGVGSCNPVPAPPTAPITPSCLMVKNLPPSYATSNDKRAILVFAGRELNGLTPRPANLANYLEGANLTAANGTTPFVYEHRAGVPTTINDRVVIVSP